MKAPKATKAPKAAKASKGKDASSLFPDEEEKDRDSGAMGRQSKRKVIKKKRPPEVKAVKGAKTTFDKDVKPSIKPKVKVKEGVKVGNFKVQQVTDGGVISSCVTCSHTVILSKKETKLLSSCPECEKKSLTIITNPLDIQSKEVAETVKTSFDADTLKNSRFAKDSGKIESLIDSGDTDQGSSLFLSAALAAAVSNLPIVEARIRETKGNQQAVYGFNSLVANIQSLIESIQATQERKNLALNLLTQVIKPALLEYKGQLITENNSLLQNLEPFIKDEDRSKVRGHVINSFKNIGSATEVKYKGIAEALTSYCDEYL